MEHTTIARGLTALVGSAALAISLGATTAGAAAARTAAASTAAAQGATTSTGDVSGSGGRLTADARAAGAAKYGARATLDQSLSAYWTPARMKAARSIEVSPSLRKQLAQYQAGARQQAKTPASATGKAATARSTAAAKSTVLRSRGGIAAIDPGRSSYDGLALTMGKVYFTKPDGNYVCSGTIVNTEGKDTVWTAGHCVAGVVNGSKQFWTNWTFVPAYDDDLANPRPWGTWSANQLWTRTAWANNSDFSQDMGVAIMNPQFGYHIVDYFGGQGFSVNRGKTVTENAFGYPAEAPFDGGNLMQCTGRTRPEWDALFVWSQTVQIPCDLTRGSSGGGWLTDFDGTYGRLNGVNSRIDRIVGPSIMLSPYFDDDAWSLFNATRNL